MRPIKAIKKVEKFLWNRLILGDKLNQWSITEIQKELKTIEPELQKCLKLYTYKDEPDNRTGYETYGYKDEESIKSNLWYISSKWKCQFRIQWLLDLIYVPHSNTLLGVG